jgi:Zn-dependent protease with chaperone function
MAQTTSMRARASLIARGSSLTVSILIAAAVAGCAADAARKAPAEVSAADTDSNSRPIDIVAVAQKSSMVVDQYCPRLVQPYRITDNALSLGKMAAELALTNAVSNLQGKLNQPAGPKTDVLATAKLAAKQLNWMPMNIERMYSEWQQKDLAANILPRIKKWEAQYAIADKILADVKGSIDEPHDYDLKIFILKNAGTNAVAYPGGFLFIDQGLLKPEFRSKAVFAVAHETAHILQRHETKEMESTVIDAVGIGNDLFKLLAGSSVNPEAVLNLATSSKGLFSKHFQDQELQADACATKMVMRIFPRPEQSRKALRDFTDSLGKLDPELPLPQPTTTMERYAVSLHVMVNTPFRRHPNTLLRRKNIDQMVAQLNVAPAPGANGAPPATEANKPRTVEGAVRH